MLHKKTVTAILLDLTQKLINDDNLSSFYLVGGTAMALQMGHRKSKDIDLFHDDPFIASGLADYVENNYKAEIAEHKKSTVKCFIKNIRVAFVAHPYPKLNPLLLDEKIRMASLEDIAAMKVNAIVNNGSRIKDFYDVYFFQEKYGMEFVLNAYLNKYNNVNIEMATKSLLYHDDIDFSVKIKLMNGDIKWRVVAKALQDGIKNYERKIATALFNEKLIEVTRKENDQSPGKENDHGHSNGPLR